MELNKYHSIHKIDSSSYDWHLRVRLQSFWKGINRETKEYYGLNMIFIDDCVNDLPLYSIQNARIHAFASKKYSEALEEKLVEGNIFILSNFKVKDYLGDEIYRPVRNLKHLYFTPHTKLEKEEEDGLPIDDYAFDLYYMEEIEKLADDNRFLCDMVGKVEHLQNLIKSTKNNQETVRLKFDITDGRFRVKVTFFDKFAISLDEAFQNMTNLNDIFVIISCGKVGRYEGAPNLTNYPATRVYINPNHYSIQELKDRIEYIQINTVQIQEVEAPKKLLTVKDIRKLKDDFKERMVNCQVTVKKVDEKSKWYYAQCTDCGIEINRQNGIFKCTNCPRIFPYPDKRFRQCTICSDHTGSIAIIFPDEEVSRLTDKTVVDIHSECLKEEEEELFPNILRMFVNQNYTITLEIKEDNIKKGSTVYEAKEILQNTEISDSFDPNNNVITQSDNASQTNDMEGSLSKNETPQTGKSSNVKVRLRSMVEPVTYDNKEHVEAPPLKIIKQEKK